MTDLRTRIEENLLPQVSKPLRYQGDEYGSIHKDWERQDLKLAFGFPDVYEIAMSHLGLSILYHQANGQEGILMERVFTPWPDMEKLMRQEGVPIFSLESRRPLTDFDGIGFTLQYELSYTNILTILDLAGIPPYAKDRTDDDPLIFMGGPCAYHPEPLAPLADFFVIGEGEELNIDVYEVIKKHQKVRGGKRDRQALLEELVTIPGVYVPSFYEPAYDDHGHFLATKPTYPLAPEVVYKRVLPSMRGAFFPTKPIVPYLDVVHDRTMLEIQRGCTRGCRFCQAGILYRPDREKPAQELLDQARAITDFTGHNEIALTSLSTSDYSCIMPLLRDMMADHEARRVAVSLPSLRADHFSVGIAEEVQKVKRTGLTFAPEAGSQRMRDVINKGVTEEDLEGIMDKIFREGWSRVKLYFMIGLPTETEEDLQGIVDLGYKILRIGDAVRKEKTAEGEKMAPVQVSISLSSFVPKPFTPFQFFPQDNGALLRKKQRFIKDQFKNRRISCSYHDTRTSFLEAVITKGDRRLAPVLLKAHELGARFDGWSEHFDLDIWMEAFETCDIDPAYYAYRKIGLDEPLPWDHISCGVSKDYLIQEYHAALAASLTEDCRTGPCTLCGVCQHYGIRPDFIQKTERGQR